MILNKQVKRAFFICLILSFYNCNLKGTYKAGNLVILDYPIETTLKTKVVRQYIDTLIRKKGYGVPEKWEHFNKLVDIDKENNVRVYFKSNPEEMYLISYSGMLTLTDVYNPKIVEADWVSKPELMPQKEYVRIKKRVANLMMMIDSMYKRGIKIKNNNQPGASMQDRPKQ